MREKLVLILALLTGCACWAFPPEYDEVVKLLREKSPQPEHSLRYLESILDAEEALASSDTAPRLAGRVEPNGENGRTAELIIPGERSRALAIGPGPAVRPDLGAIRDADLRRNLASQFDLAEQMAQHAYLHVNRERIFSEIPKEDRWRRLDRVYRRWTDASQRDDVFRPGNIEYLVTFWIACVELDYFDELTRAATENRRGLDAADTWFLGALTEVEESFAFPQRLLELRPRDLIAAKERAWNRLATSSLGEYLDGAGEGATEDVVALLQRLREPEHRPLIFEWIVRHASSEQALIEALDAELWDEAFLRYSVRNGAETPEELVDLLKTLATDPFNRLQVVREGSGFVDAWDRVRDVALPRLRVSPEKFFERFIEAILNDSDFQNFKVAALVHCLSERLDDKPEETRRCADLEGGLKRLVRKLTEAPWSEYAWSAPAQSEATFIILRLIVSARGWDSGSSESARDMVRALDSDPGDPFERAAARSALEQFTPHLFGQVLARRFEDRVAGGKDFSDCVEAIFRAAEGLPGGEESP